MGREIGYRFENGFNGMFRWGNAYSVHRGGSKDGRRMISAAGILLWAVLLSGCGQGMDTGIVQTADSHVQAAGTAPQESPVSGAESAADHAGPVSGVQFVEGHGICAPESPPVYYMDPGQQPIESEGAKAWLESVTYQDGKWYYRVKVEDYSATVIPDDGNWVCQSSDFLDRAGLGSGAGRQTGESMADYIEGTGIPGGRVTAARRASSIEYGTYETKGCLTIYLEYFTENQALDSLSPQGTYELHVPGFEQAFSFTFVKAGEYPAAEDIPGIVFHEGMGIMAKGQWTDTGLDITYYTYPEQGYIMYPVLSGLSYRKGDLEGYGRLRDRGHSANVSWDYLSGLPEGIQGQTISYDLAPSAKGGRIWLGFDSVGMVHTGEPVKLLVPVRDGPADLDTVIELEECTVKFTSARQSGEPIQKDAWGEDGTGPFVFVGTEVRMRDPSRKFTALIMHKAVENPASYPYPITARPVYDESGANGNNSGNAGLKGYEISCSECGSAVELEINGVMYDWEQEFLVPVQIDGL